jgi:hypothetical protein
MKRALAITAAGLMSFGIVGPATAAAYHLSPENAKFKGTGTTSATKSGITLNCNAKFKGKVGPTGVGKITAGSFTGELGCSAVGLGGLPWKAAATSQTNATIYNVSFTSPIGNCGPGDIATTLQNGVITFTNVALAGGCTVSGSITTNPKLSIVSGASWQKACRRVACAPAFRDAAP